MRIGPTFPAELKNAGVFGLPFSWDEDGNLAFSEDMSPEQIATVEGVLAAHDPSKTDPAAQIASIEAAQPVTQRALRELMLVIGQAYPAAQQSVFYKRAAAQEALIAPLRSQL